MKMLNEQFFFYNPGGFDHLKPILQRQNINHYMIEYIIKNSDLGCTRVLRGPFIISDYNKRPIRTIDPSKDPY